MWRNFVLGVAFGAGSLMGTQVLADSLDLNLNDDSLRLTYEAEIGSGMKGLAMDAGYYYNDNRDSDINDSDMVHLGLHVGGNNWSQSGIFNIKIGGRLMYTDLETSDLVLLPGPLLSHDVKKFDAMALGLGGEVRFSPVKRLGLGASAYYAPRITSFLDAERYSEYGVKLDYQLLTQAYIYVGYRQINIELENYSRDIQLDDRAHVGMTLLF